MVNKFVFSGSGEQKTYILTSITGGGGGGGAGWIIFFFFFLPNKRSLMAWKLLFLELALAMLLGEGMNTLRGAKL
jgi:membrane-associated PAP2 superfamily phosphatase